MSLSRKGFLKMLGLGALAAGSKASGFAPNTTQAGPSPPIPGRTQATSAAAARSIRDLLIGKDPLAIDGLLREIGPLVHSNPSAVAAFDMALHDILGKVAGRPLFLLLGGTKTTFETH